jgi:hypothetical protein
LFVLGLERIQGGLELLSRRTSRQECGSPKEAPESIAAFQADVSDPKQVAQLFQDEATGTHTPQGRCQSGDAGKDQAGQDPTTMRIRTR